MFRPGPAGSPYSDFPLISGGGGPGFVDFFESLGRTIAFHPELARMLGSRNAALFLQQLMWWTPKGKDPDGWIYKSAKEWEEETTLTYEEQRALRALLGKKKLRVVEERYARFEHRLYFRVNRKRLNALWDAWIGEAHGEFPGRHRGNSQIDSTRRGLAGEDRRRFKLQAPGRARASRGLEVAGIEVVAIALGALGCVDDVHLDVAGLQLRGEASKVVRESISYLTHENESNNRYFDHQHQ
jgi:hypothetical protein